MENIVTKINQASLKFLEPLTLEKTYQIIIEEALKLVNMDDGFILLKEKNTLKNVYGSTKAAANIKPPASGLKKYLQPSAFIQEGDNVKEFNNIKNICVQSVLFIPLSNRNHLIGVLVLRSCKSDMSLPNEGLEVFNLFGSLASLAIRKAQLYNEVKTAMDTRDFFISMAAHELRTPLTAVNGYIQLLYSKRHSEDTPESKWIKNLLWESQRLTLLINELLEVDRIKAGELQYNWNYHHLRIILERAINNLSFTYPNRSITYNDTLGNDDDVFIGDFDKILQAITNLLENAAKFSPANSDIILTITSDKDNLIVSIQDFGYGIPEEILPKLFEGYTVHHANDTQGMGLGLYLVKNILRLHKGKIDIQTKEKEGTTAIVTIPKPVIE